MYPTHPFEAAINEAMLAQVAEPDFGFGQNEYREFCHPDVFHPASISLSRRRQVSALGVVTYTYKPPAPAITETLCSTPTNVSPALTESESESSRRMDACLEVDDRSNAINVQGMDDHPEWSTSARTRADSHCHFSKSCDRVPASVMALGLRETGPATRVGLEDNDASIDSNPSTPELVHMPSPLISCPSPQTPIARAFIPPRFYDSAATKEEEVDAWRHDVPSLDGLETQRRPDSRIHQRPCLHRHCSYQDRAAQSFSQEFAEGTLNEELPTVPDPIQIDSNYHSITTTS